MFFCSFDKILMQHYEYFGSKTTNSWLRCAITCLHSILTVDSRQRMLEEQKFKDQLREGFLELRNHHQNKSGMNRPSSQNNMYSAPPTGVVAPTQQQMVPRNRGQTEPPRPLSMHATPSGQSRVQIM